MIRYALKCEAGHGFEAWFRNSGAFDEQRSAGQVACAVCGSRSVEKAVMAPSVASGGASDAASAAPVPERPLSAPATPAEAALRALREKIEKTSDYVGREFAQEARRIHEGESAERPIWGEASIKDAKALHDDGIPVTPIPFMRRRND